MNVSRIALIAAAALALIAGALAIRRTRDVPPPPAPVAQQQPDVGQMIAGLEAKLKASPNDAEGWRMLGLSFFETGRFGESATAYKRASALAPDSAETWSALGEALVLAGPGTVPPDARAAFETALRIDPRDPRARYFLAVGKDMAGDHKGAIDDWIALLKDSPADAPWQGDVRRIVTQVGAKEKIDVASRLAAIRPAAPAQSTAAAPIPGPSPDQMRAASALPPGQQDAMVNQMVSGLAAKLAADPKNPDGWIMLMRSRVQLGQQREAAAALKSALAANPGSAPQLNAAAAELGIARP